MEKYIPLDAVVAEINRVLNSYDPNEITSGRYALVDLRDFLDTLEVKEVDLEKEFENYMDKYNGVWVDSDYIRFAKHFFELGLKAQKNEPVSDDLQEEITRYFSKNPIKTLTDWPVLKNTALHFANWQKEQKNIWHTMDETPNYPCDILFLTDVDNMFLYRYMENGRPVDKETPYFHNILKGKCWCYCNDIVNK